MLKSNSVLITGASRGIGLEFARQYIQAGWRVYATCRYPERAYDLNQLAVSSSKNIIIHQLDVTNGNHITTLKKLLHQQPLDVLINNAGVLGPKQQNFGNTDVDAWAHTMRVNAIAPLKIMEAFIDNVAASERRLIVNLTSRMGSITANNSGDYYIYRSSKAALNAVIRNAALDLTNKGITVVALHPGWVRTDMGGAIAEIEVTQSVTCLLTVINQIEAKDNGKFFDLNGFIIPW